MFRRAAATVSLLVFGSVAAPAARREAAETRHPSFVEESPQFRFRALEDDQQGFYVVWSHALKDGWTLIGQHIEAQGAPTWERPGLLLSREVYDTESWDAFPDGAGGLVVVWASAAELVAQHWKASGQAQWGETGVRLSTGTCRFPTGVADAAGGAYLVWSERRYADRMVLVSQHVSANGTFLWAKEGYRVSLRPSDQQRARSVYDGQAGAVIVWKDTRENASQIQAQRMDFQGNRLWGMEGLVVTAPAGSSKEYPLVEPLGDGGAVVAWAAPGSAANRLFLQSIDSRGNFRWDPGGVPMTLGTWDQWNPTLLATAQGTVWAGWEDYRNHIRWQAFVSVIGSRATNARPSGQAPLAPMDSDQGHLALADDGRGGIFAAWQDNRSGSSGVYLQEMNARLEPLLGDTGKTVADRLVNPATPQLVNVAPGRVAILVADHEKKNRWALYWTALNGPKVPPPAASETPAGLPTPEPPGEGMSYP